MGLHFELPHLEAAIRALSQIGQAGSWEQKLSSVSQRATAEVDADGEGTEGGMADLLCWDGLRA